jgi:hypothetical protein
MALLMMVLGESGGLNGPEAVNRQAWLVERSGFELPRPLVVAQADFNYGADFGMHLGSRNHVRQRVLLH